jgi:DNA-binding transcriptional ArsR family regulator
MRPIHHPNKADITLAGVLHALGDPIRLEIIRNLAAHGQRCCSSTIKRDLPKSTLSHHFRVLRDAGLIRMRKEGVYFVNTLRRDELDERFPGLLASVLAACADTGPRQVDPERRPAAG